MDLADMADSTDCLGFFVFFALVLFQFIFLRTTGYVILSIQGEKI